MEVDNSVNNDKLAALPASQRSCDNFSLDRAPAWLPPALRRVIMAELNLSPRHQNRRIEEARTTTLRFLIEERKQAMRAQGQRPRGGVHEAAVAEIADQQSMTVPALKQRLRRLNQRARKTRRQ